MKMNEVLNTSIHSLSHQLRYAGMHAGHRENVAEHSFYVAVIADWIVSDLCIDNVDADKVMRMAIYHDVEEAYTGDIVTPVKYRSNSLRDEWDKLSLQLLEEGLEHDFRLTPAFSARIQDTHVQYESEKMITVEGQIVKFADMLQSFIYLVRELKGGNQHAHTVLTEVVSNMHALFDPHELWRSYLMELDSIANRLRDSQNKFLE